MDQVVGFGRMDFLAKQTSDAIEPRDAYRSQTIQLVGIVDYPTFQRLRSCPTCHPMLTDRLLYASDGVLWKPGSS